MTQQMVWKCEQWFGGQVKEQNVFRTEELAREYARKLAGMSPDLVFKIEPMPIQHVWNRRRRNGPGGEFGRVPHRAMVTDRLCSSSQT